MKAKTIIQFVEESNLIEGINRAPTIEEVAEFKRFMELPIIRVADLEKFVSVYQPDARLRDAHGLDVMVGAHVPMRGGPQVRDAR